jgi:hypothetical protein
MPQLLTQPDNGGTPSWLVNPLPPQEEKPPQPSLLSKLTDWAVTRSPPAQLLKGAYSGVTFPGDVVAGKADPYDYGRALDFAGAVTGGSAAIPTEANELRMGASGLRDKMAAIKAYHGSPHSFDQFDLSKIGTGEGAQAFGHGLYFAENEGTAKAYRDALSKPAYGSPEHVASNVLDATNGNPAEAIAEMERRKAALAGTPGADPTAAARFDAAIDVLKSGKPLSGHMYEVNINADPSHLLDWDKPLSGDVAEAAFSALTENGIDKTLARYIVDNKTGSDVYSTLSRGTYDTRLAPSDVGAPVASKALQDAGVPGIKYLDAGSRSAGEGSRNYVVFDPKLIDIVRKYGIAGAIAAGALTAEQARQLTGQQGNQQWLQQGGT